MLSHPLCILLLHEEPLPLHPASPGALLFALLISLCSRISGNVTDLFLSLYESEPFTLPSAMEFRLAGLAIAKSK